MTIEETGAWILQEARTAKSAHVARARQGSTDLPTVVEAYRGGEPVARATMNPDRDLMLKLASWCAVGLSADVVALTCEAWTHGEGLNPVTGEEWQPGDAGVVALEHDGLAKGWVSEGLVISIFNRADDELVIQQTYSRQAKTVTYAEHVVVRDADGYLAGAMRETMRQPTQLEKLSSLPEAVSMTPDELVLTADLGALRALQSFAPNARIQFYARPGSRRHQALRALLDRADILTPPGQDPANDPG